MKFLFFLPFALMSIFIFAKKFDGYYITNQNDTINAQIEIGVNFMNENLLNDVSIRKKVSVYVNGEKQNFKPYEIKGFYIYEQGGIKFQSITVKKKKIFARVKAEGDLSVYVFTYGVSFSIDNKVIIKYKDKDAEVVGSIKETLKYLDNHQYFKSRFDSSGGDWTDLLIVFAEDYNKLNRKKD